MRLAWYTESCIKKAIKHEYIILQYLLEQIYSKLPLTPSPFKNTNNKQLIFTIICGYLVLVRTGIEPMAFGLCPRSVSPQLGVCKAKQILYPILLRYLITE